MTGRATRGLVILAFLGLLGGVFLLSMGRNASSQVLDLPEGSKYEGEVVNGKPHGRGIQTWPEEGARYEGNFVEGKFHGKGILIGADGSRYEGDWVDGAHHGKGILTLPDGTRYEGDFVGGMRHGLGTLKDKNGKILKKGRFVNDEYVGP